MTHILTLNAGSSSLKIGLFDSAPEPRHLAHGLIERIGGAAHMVMSAEGRGVIHDALLEASLAGDHAGALRAALAEIARDFPEAQIGIVGHRIVHGGRDFARPTVLTPEVMARLATFESFAPLHQPHNLAGVRAAQSTFPKALQLGCFDTAFHAGHDFVTDAYALPRRYYDAGVRRYGFHGLSYDYIASRLAEAYPQIHAGRVVVAHLGNGASACAMRAGVSQATTMGFSALDGLCMGTRCGQIDPGVLLYLQQQEGLSLPEVQDLLYLDSGLKGLSGISHDMRSLLDSAAPEAAEAVTLFCERIIEAVARLAAGMRGLDAVVFTGGIGEHAAPVRAQVAEGLGWLGARLDAAANAAGAPVISTTDSAVQMLVLPTDEERVIARAASAYAVSARPSGGAQS